MAVMSDADRRACWADLMSTWSEQRKPIPFEKDEGRAAINIIDQWLEDQDTSFMNVIPLKVRTQLGDEQLSELLTAVQRRRMNVKGRDSGKR